MNRKTKKFLIPLLSFAASIVIAVQSVSGQVAPEQLRPRAYFPIMRKSPPVQSVNVGFEVSQGIQRPDNGVPLVSYRPTIVRVTLTSSTPRSNVSAWLQVFNSNGFLGSVAAINNPRTLKATADRAQLNDTFNFRVPTQWLNGNVTFRVFATNSTDYAAQSQAQTFTFSPVPPLHVTIVPVHYTCTSGGSGTSVPTPPYDYIINNFTRKVYPVPEVTLQVHAPVAHRGPCTNNVPNPSYQDWGSMLDLVTGIWQAEGTPVRYYYGLLNVYCEYGCIAGVGWLGGYRAAVGFTGFDSNPSVASQVHAHEVGHNHGVEHMPGCGASDPDPRFPYTDSQGRARIGNTTFPNFGLDVFDTPTLYPFYNYLFDYMSYCRPVWTSDFVYNLIRDYALRYNNAANMLDVAEASPHFLVSGRLMEEGTQLDPLFIIETRLDDTTRAMMFDNPAGMAELELLDAEGNVLATHPIPLRKTSHHDPQGREQLGFNTAVPFVEGVRAVRLRQGAQVLAERVGGQRAPRLAPVITRATTNGSAQTFSWSAQSDNDQALRYLVRLSTDRGKTWQMVALTDAPSFTLDATAAPELFREGTPWIEVQASDGVRTTTRRFAPTAEDRLVAVEGE